MWIEARLLTADHPFAVAHYDVLFSDAKLHEQTCTCNRCSSGSVDDEPQAVESLTLYVGGVYHGCGHDSGSAVLIIVHDGDSAFTSESFFYGETFGCLDVFKIDAAE